MDTSRLDQVLNLSGEIGLTKTRLNALRSDILNGRSDTETLHALDLAVSQLDLLVSDLVVKNDMGAAPYCDRLCGVGGLGLTSGVRRTRAGDGGQPAARR